MTGEASDRLGSVTWPEVGDGALLVVPLGSVEQHGPHLPLDTDTRIAVAAAQALVTARADAWQAPAFAYGASGEHAGFPGTLSLGVEALTTALVELVRSADRFAGVVFVNGHGGNGVALRAAVDRSRADGRRALAVPCSVPGGDAHAGRTETSILLHLAPEVVRFDRAEAGERRPWSEIGPAVVADGVAAVAPNGVLGDPTGASAAEGAVLWAGLVDRVIGAVAAWADD